MRGIYQKLTNIYIWLWVVMLMSAVSLVLFLFGAVEQSKLVVIVLCSIGAVIELVAIVKDLLHKKVGVDILAALAIISALMLQQYTAAIVILLMLTTGNALENFAKNRAKKELDALMHRVPKVAHVKRGKGFFEVEASKVVVGNIVLIKPGEVVAVDGRVLNGESSFDESAITGESLPKQKSKGMLVLSGSVNQDAPVEICTVRSSKDSQYEQIIELVRAAASSKSPLVRMADRYSVPFTLLALALAAMAWLISGDPLRALAVLVVATPCPLIIATPVAIVSGMSRLARNGIIVKDGAAVENMARLNMIAFDKTGTLTNNHPEVQEINCFGVSKNELIRLTASAEQESNHVLAQAIVAQAKKYRIKLTKPQKVYENFGSGIAVALANSQILVGRLDYLQKNKVVVSKQNQQLKDTAVYCAKNGKLIGSFVFYDPARSNASSTLAKLKSLGIKKFAMLTGDNNIVAQNIAKSVKIDDIHSGLLPKQKLQIINNYKKNGLVAMVGDGVNDAPTLAAADVGIALGAKGSTAASESADVVVMLDDISKVAEAIFLAKKIVQIAKQSIFVGIGLSTVLMLFAVAGKIVPLQGALLQELVDVAVILNALRALNVKINTK